MINNNEITIEQWLIKTASLLNHKREAEWLLMHYLKCSNTYLFTHNTQLISYLLSDLELQSLNEAVQRRLNGEPFAYITGEKEFWSLSFSVTPDILIPRPETELLIDIVLQEITQTNASILDLGTGSGAIAISLAYERVNWKINATDASLRALEVAKQNAFKILGKHSIQFHQAIWLDHDFQTKFTAIISNPPYIKENDSHLSALTHEPIEALTAGKDGLDDIRIIIKNSPEHLHSNGWLLLEHGYDQAQAVTELLKTRGFHSIHTWQDYADIPRITGGKFL